MGARIRSGIWFMAHREFTADQIEIVAGGGVRGIIWLCAGIAVFSMQDVIIKSLSGAYPLTEIVFLRSMIGAPLLLAAVGIDPAPPTLRTRHRLLNLVRSALAFASYMSFYLALAEMSLAETVAIGFSAPLFITLLSALFLGERVGPARWAAVLVGFGGMLAITRPGVASFQPAAGLALVCAVCYSGSQLLTRKIGRSDSGALMSLYTAMFYLAVSAGLGLVLGGGAFAGSSHPSAAFLFRAWVVPDVGDMALMLSTGAISAFGFYALAQAYRVGEASIVAPFEYSGLFWALLWGFVIWGEMVDGLAGLGMVAIVGSGLYVIVREQRRQRPLVSRRGRLRMRSGY